MTLSEQLQQLQEQIRQLAHESRRTNDIVLSMLTEFRREFANVYTELRHTQGHCECEQQQKQVSKISDVGLWYGT